MNGRKTLSPVTSVIVRPPVPSYVEDSKDATGLVPGRDGDRPSTECRPSIVHGPGTSRDRPTPLKSKLPQPSRTDSSRDSPSGNPTTLRVSSPWYRRRRESKCVLVSVTVHLGHSDGVISHLFPPQSPPPSSLRPLPLRHPSGRTSGLTGRTMSTTRGADRPYPARNAPMSVSLDRDPQSEWGQNKKRDGTRSDLRSEALMPCVSICLCIYQ